MAARWIGSTAGSDSGSSYVAASTNLTIADHNRLFLHALRFYAIEARTYELRLDGVTVASVVASAAAVATFTLASMLRLLPGAHSLSVRPDTSAKVRYVAGSGSALEAGISVAGWTEFVTGGYYLPWEMSVEDLYVTEWEVVNPGVVSGSPVPTPGIVVNGGGSGGTSGPTTGQVWPR